MLKKLAVKILKKEIKKLNPEKLVDTLLELLEDKAREFIVMWNHIMILVGYCIVYVDSFYENQNLQEAIQEKMAINFNRPYKYNTFEEMQK